MAPLAVLPNLRVDATTRDAGVGKTTAAAGFGNELARQLVRSEAEATKTPLKGSDAAAALSGAWRTVTGQTPNPKLLSVLVAQWSHETGRGEAMLNYNFGGIKGSAPSGLSAVYRTHEGSGEKAR